MRGIRRMTVALTLAGAGIAAVTGTASAVTRDGAAPPARMVVVRAVASGGVTDLPLVGGQVEVRHGGERIGRGRTGSEGLAMVNVRHVPRVLTVTVRGATVDGKRFKAPLVARVVGYRAPRQMCVTPETTMVAAAMDADPRLSLREARERVRKYLVLPPDDNLGCDAARSNATFDGHVFLAEAARHDGVRLTIVRDVRAMLADPAAVNTSYRTAGSVPIPQQPVAPRSPRRGVHALAGTQWAGTGANVANGMRFAFDGLSKTGAFSQKTLGWLTKAGGWSTLTYVAFKVIDAFVGSGNSGNPEVISELDQHFTALDDSIGQLRDSVAQVQQAITQVEAGVLGGTQATLVADAAAMASAIRTNGTYLMTIVDAANQITCGPSGLQAHACTSDQRSVAEVCPKDTLLTWDGQENKVVYPKRWGATSSDPLAQLCINYSLAIYGGGGFVAQMSGSAAAGGNPSNALNWSSLGTLESYVNGTGSVPGIVQLTSMGTVNGTRFIDNSASQLTAAVFDYYLGLYQQLMDEMMVYTAAISEPLNNRQTGLSAQPTVGQFEASAPTTVPPGTVVDTATGLVWSQGISANLPCDGGQCYGGTGTLRQAPATLTPTGIQGANGQTVSATSGTPPTLNSGSGAVTPLNPMTVTSQNTAAEPLRDWYVASAAQAMSLFSTANPASPQTAGDWLQTAAGFSPAVFGPGIFTPVSSREFQRVGTKGLCWLNASDCYTVPLSDGVNACTLSGNAGCAAPALIDGFPAYTGGMDLNNAATSSGQGALQSAIASDNWASDKRYCTSTSIWDFSCYDDSWVSYASTFSAIDQSRGWVTWFVRVPPAPQADQPRECYYYPPPGSAQVAGLAGTAGGPDRSSSACGPPAFPGNNGLLSQALTPGVVTG